MLLFDFRFEVSKRERAREESSFFRSAQSAIFVVVVVVNEARTVRFPSLSFQKLSALGLTTRVHTMMMTITTFPIVDGDGDGGCCFQLHCLMEIDDENHAGKKNLTQMMMFIAADR